MSGAGTVTVTFVDADTGQVMARSDLPATQLPDSFAVDTTLHLGDDPWAVERAEPLTAAEAVAAGRLVLTVRRLQRVSPQELLFSLPTICDALPAVDAPSSTSTEPLVLHEDDWRQVELVSRGLAPAVETELDAIRRVYTRHGHRGADDRIVAFREIHVRSITSIAYPLSWPRLRDLLPAADHEYAGVQFSGSTGLVVGSFALGFGPLTCYGILEEDQAPVVGLHLTAGAGAVPVAALQAVLRGFDLAVVDWCRCVIVDADHLADYVNLVASPGGAVG